MAKNIWRFARNTLSEIKTLKLTPLSETTSILASFICESPRRGSLLLSLRWFRPALISLFSVKRPGVFSSPPWMDGLSSSIYHLGGEKHCEIVHDTITPTRARTLIARSKLHNTELYRGSQWG